MVAHMTNLLRFDDLRERGIFSNRTTLYRWIKERGFPRGTLIGPNTRVWTEKEVEAWIAEQVRVSDTEPAPAAA
jgi:predicted DNA-binding transcriptional regulator AlpA